MQGKNVHLFKTSPGATKPNEWFIIGDKEYSMVNGSPKETIGQVGLDWVFWPLNVTVPYAFGTTLHAEKTGEETVNGRSAVVYDFDTSKASQAALAGMGVSGTTGMSLSKGTVWIDQATGGMLKLSMEYVTGVSNMDATKTIGQGTGHITLEVSQVGQVTVVSPVK